MTISRVSIYSRLAYRIGDLRWYRDKQGKYQYRHWATVYFIDKLRVSLHKRADHLSHCNSEFSKMVGKCLCAWCVKKHGGISWEKMRKASHHFAKRTVIEQQEKYKQSPSKENKFWLNDAIKAFKRYDAYMPKKNIHANATEKSIS